MHHVHVPDRAALADAADLIDRYGASASEVASSRAEKSRDLGNVIHFCRWRQIERTIGMLSRREATGSIH